MRKTNRRIKKEKEEKYINPSECTHPIEDIEHSLGKPDWCSKCRTEL
jgi:hypothetical protein